MSFAGSLALVTRLGYTPARARILAAIVDAGETSPVEIHRAGAAGAAVSLGTIAYHVRVLRDAELIEQTRVARRRGSIEHYYRATDAGRRTLYVVRPADDPLGVLDEIANLAEETLRRLDDGTAANGRGALTTIMQRARDAVRHHHEDAAINAAKEDAMPTLNSDQKDRLLAIAEQAADELAERYGRARIGGPTYSAADLRRGGWSTRVTGMSDDVERETVTVFLDGTREIVGDVIECGDCHQTAAAGRVEEFGTVAGIDHAPGCPHAELAAVAADTNGGR